MRKHLGGRARDKFMLMISTVYSEITILEGGLWNRKCCLDAVCALRAGLKNGCAYIYKRRGFYRGWIVFLWMFSRCMWWVCSGYCPVYLHVPTIYSQPLAIIISITKKKSALRYWSTRGTVTLSSTYSFLFVCFCWPWEVHFLGT